MTIQEWLGTDNTLGVDIWERKYRNGDETFDEWIDRVSGGNETIKKLIIEKKFLFGGRILANRGLDAQLKKTSLSNCYVIEPPEDNIESIFECGKKLARTYSFGGGCGIDLSRLAPRGAKVRNAANKSSGAVSFMDLYSTITGTISQAGRRGALMISLSCDHPDIEEFIHVKDNLDKVNYANISVRITDKFMDAVRNDGQWKLSYTRAATGEVIENEVSARALYNALAKGNWDMGEPGMLFWDRIEQWNLLANTPNFRFSGTNPCAEEPLPAGGACNLGSINLSEFVTGCGIFDFDAFADTVFSATMALNEVLEEGIPMHPLEEQRKCVADWRQVGLGVMGIADMLIKMGIRYGSQESIELCSNIGSYMINYSMLASATLAQEHGTYPYYNYECVASTEFYKQNVWERTDDAVRQYGLRNSQLLTIAPTGTLSTMLRISGGVEPIFATSYVRRTQSLHGTDVCYKVYTPIIREVMDKLGITEEEKLPPYCITSQQIPYKERIKMQAAWQQYIDASISSTINLPNEATVEDVEALYMEAWESGLKGVTVFRDGCRRAGVLFTEKGAEKHNEPVSDETSPKRGEVVSSSDTLIGKKRKLITGCGSLHCTAFFDPATGELMETYLNKGSTGGCNSFMIGLSRMISLSARAGCSVHDIIDQLSSSPACPSYAVRRAKNGDTSKGACCPQAVSNALLDMWNEMQEELRHGEVKPAEKQEKQEEPASANDYTDCPECGSKLEHAGGCAQCPSCGWSKCG